jgi:hypothetical protein
MMTLEQTAALVSVVVAIGGGLFVITPVMRSDDAPWANVERVEKASKHIVKKIDDLERTVRSGQLTSQILGMWRGMCDATRDRNMVAAGAYAARLTELQEEYQMLNGLEYPIARCV